MKSTVCQRVLIDEAIAGLFQRARARGRSPRAWAVNEALRPLVGKAIAPLAHRGIGKVPGVRDRLEALAFDDCTHGLSPAEDARRFGLFQAGVSGGEGAVGKVQCEGPHASDRHNKVRQNHTNLTLPHGLPLLSTQSLADSNFPEVALSGENGLSINGSTADRPSVKSGPQVC
jgi:hypothetical protein